MLTLGGPVAEWRHGRIDAVLSVGPMECMPNKIAEAQLFHVAEREGLPSLTLPMNGDPLDTAVIDRFVYEVQTQFRRGRTRPGNGRAAHRLLTPGEGYGHGRACGGSAPVPRGPVRAGDADG